MERTRTEIDSIVRRLDRNREAMLATEELARDRRGLALRDMALRPFRRVARRLRIALTAQLTAAAAERAPR